MNLKSLLLFCTNTYMIRSLAMLISPHIKCRGGAYPRSSILRFPVPDDKINWTVEYPEYEPPFYTAASIHGQPWADLKTGMFIVRKLNETMLAAIRSLRNFHVFHFIRK